MEFINIFKGIFPSIIGCDDKAVIHILTTRSNKQRQQISLAYKTAHGRVSMNRLASLFYICFGFVYSRAFVAVYGTVRLFVF